MNQQRFIEDVFEIAFGDSAIYKGYTMEEVLEKLREFSDHALIAEEKGLIDESSNIRTRSAISQTV